MIYLIDDTPRSASIWNPLWPVRTAEYRKRRSLLDDIWPVPSSILDDTDGIAGLASIIPTRMTLQFDKKNNTYVVEAPTPGVKKEELKIEIVGERKVELSIEQGVKDEKKNEGSDHGKKGGEKDGEKEGQEAPKVVRKFCSSVTLPKDADASNGKMEYADGLLRVVFPKLSEEDTKKLQIANEAQHANLATEVKERLDKVKQLRDQLEAEAAEAAKVQAKLKEARAQAEIERSAKRQRLQ